MKVIYADFNDFSEDGVLPLTFVGSRESISSFGSELSDGESVWLSDGEMWAKGRIFYVTDGEMEARADWCFHDDDPREENR